MYMRGMCKVCARYVREYVCEVCTRFVREEESAMSIARDPYDALGSLQKCVFPKLCSEPEVFGLRAPFAYEGAGRPDDDEELPDHDECGVEF